MEDRRNRIHGGARVRRRVTIGLWTGRSYCPVGKQGSGGDVGVRLHLPLDTYCFSPVAAIAWFEADAEEYYRAANEPKSQVWYGEGHSITSEMIVDHMEWLGERIGLWSTEE